MMDYSYLVFLVFNVQKSKDKKKTPPFFGEATYERLLRKGLLQLILTAIFMPNIQNTTKLHSCSVSTRDWRPYLTSKTHTNTFLSILVKKIPAKYF